MDEGRKVIVEQEGSFKQREARLREGAFESFQVEQRGRGCSWNSRHLEALEGSSQLSVAGAALGDQSLESGSGTTSPGFRSWLCHLSAECSSGTYLIFPRLSFLL